MNISFYDPSEYIYGLSYGAWTVKWWQWIWSIPDANNPINDLIGKSASLNQPDRDVWFLVGTWATERLINIPNREVTIPADRAILFPVINCEANPIEYPYLKTNEDIINHVVNDENTIVLKEAYINNIPIPSQRIRSDPILFPLKIPDKNNNNIHIVLYS